MRAIDNDFYRSRAWDKCRKAYAKSKGGLCERCLAHGIYTPGEIVHHKTHLTQANINDPAFAFGFDNLELLCRKCHNEIHGKAKRYFIDNEGKVIAL